MATRLRVLLSLISGCALLGFVGSVRAEGPCPAVPALTSPNTKVIISDLHLGPGKTANGRWHPLEDFRFAETFEKFITSLGDANDLIIAGDFIDFWQILPELDQRRLADLGPSEAESLKKLEAAIKAHRETFQTLREFAHRGRNRVFLIPGNHDIDLAWPGVQQSLVRELGDSSGLRVMVVNPCYKADGIYVEHGNRYDESNRFASQEQPFIKIANRTWLQTNFGSTFLSRFYNRVESRKPFIDNLYPELAAVGWAVQYEPILSSLPHAANFAIMLALSQTSLKNLGFVISELGPPEARPETPPKTLENLLRLYDIADPAFARMLRTAVQNAAGRSEGAEAMKSLTDEDWQRLNAGITPAPSTLKVVLQIDPYVEAARRIVVTNSDVDVVIMGHTHEVDRTEVTKLKDVGAEPKWYVNTGAWQKTAAVEDVRLKSAWSKLSIDDAAVFPEHFSYVNVTYGANGKPNAVRRFWPR